MTREQIATEIVQAVAELPDRTSPDEWPEAMLVTAVELQSIVLAALAAPVAVRTVPESFSTGGDRHNAAKAWLNGYDTAQRGAAPVAAEPPSLVALRNNWQLYRSQTPRSFNGEAADPRVVEAENRLIDVFIQQLGTAIAAQAEPSMEKAKASILAAQAHNWPPPDNAPGTTPDKE